MKKLLGVLLVSVFLAGMTTSLQAAKKSAPQTNAPQANTQAPAANGQAQQAAESNVRPPVLDPEKIKQMGFGTKAQNDMEQQIQQNKAAFKEKVKKTKIRLMLFALGFVGVLMLLVLIAVGFAYWSDRKKK